MKTRGTALTDNIFLCFGCGQRNRVKPGAPRASAKCGSCGEYLFPEEEEASKTAQSNDVRAPRRQPPSPPSPLGPKLFRSAYTVFFFCVVGLIGWTLYDSIEPQETIAPENLPPAVYQVPGIMWKETGRWLEAPLRIETSAGADYYVKLVDWLTGGTVMTLFVRGGQPLEVKVPLGSYRFKYASGDTWRGEYALFGPGKMTRYSEAGTRFDFVDRGTYISGYTIELIQQVGGNLATRSISPSSF